MMLNMIILFIIVDQKPLDSLFGVPHLIGDSISGAFGRDVAPRRDILDNSKFHQYWIINKITDDVYGPFNKSEVLSQKERIRCKN